jgi:hypothetical protein
MSNNNDTTTQDPNTDPNAGKGGSYTVDPVAQTRTLMQRTNDNVPVDKTDVPPDAPPPRRNHDDIVAPP